jgi:hypothetical protein
VKVRDGVVNANTEVVKVLKAEIHRIIVDKKYLSEQILNVNK